MDNCSAGLQAFRQSVFHVLAENGRSRRAGARAVGFQGMNKTLSFGPVVFELVYRSLVCRHYIRAEQREHLLLDVRTCALFNVFEH